MWSFRIVKLYDSFFCEMARMIAKHIIARINDGRVVYFHWSDINFHKLEEYLYKYAVLDYS
jgi:hypothetical protein